MELHSHQHSSSSLAWSVPPPHLLTLLHLFFLSLFFFLCLPLFVRRHFLQLVSFADPLICNVNLPQAVAAAFLTKSMCLLSTVSPFVMLAQLFLAFVVTGHEKLLVILNL